MNTQIQTLSFDTLPVQFSSDAFLNATAIAKHFGKRPNDYLKTEQTQEYIAALAEHLSVTKKIVTDKNQLVIVKQGNSSKFEQGTWLHPKLAIHFARWLNPKFAVWCDEQIENLLNPTIQLPTPRYPALTEQDKKDLPAPLGAYALKLAGWLAKSKGVPQSQIEQQAVEQCSEYRDKAFIHQPKHFFNRAAAWLHQELDKLPVVDFGVCRDDLLNIFKRQCAYKQDFENWNDYQLKSWLDERFFRNRQGGFVGYPTSLESAGYKQLEKLVDEMKRELGKDFKLLDLSQQPKQAAALPKLCTSDGSIGQVLFDYGAKNPRGGDVALALQDMALLRSTFDHLTYVNYDSDRLNKKEMAQVAEAGKILNGLSVMLMEAASETLKH